MKIDGFVRVSHDISIQDLILWRAIKTSSQETLKLLQVFVEDFKSSLLWCKFPQCEIASRVLVFSCFAFVFHSLVILLSPDLPFVGILLCSEQKNLLKKFNSSNINQAGSLGALFIVPCWDVTNATAFMQLHPWGRRDSVKLCVQIKSVEKIMKGKHEQSDKRFLVTSNTFVPTLDMNKQRRFKQ